MKLLLLLLLPLQLLSQQQTILFKNVNIIDVKKGRVIKNQNVLIEGNRIINISSKLISSKGATIINATGKYLMPGLWDMHVHTLEEDWFKWQFPLFVLNGITGFREMWGKGKLVDSIKSEMQNGSLPFFNFVASRHIIDGQKAFWPGSLSISNPASAANIVDSLIAAGSDFIKLYSFLDPEIFYAIAKRCREKKFPFAGHVPHQVWLTDASKSGMASMEHLYGFLTEACSFPDSAMKIRKKSAEDFEAGVPAITRQQNSRAGETYILNNFSEKRMRNIAKVLSKNKTYIVPTLVTLRGDYFANDTSFTNDERLIYMSKSTKDYWKEETEKDLKRNTEKDWQNKRKRWQIEQKIIKILSEEKVLILAGSDSDNPFAFPGFSLHDELALFVGFGMTPLNALRTATINPAIFLNKQKDLGTVEKGKLADLVLLDTNPLQDINNTRKINAVVANGRLLQRKDLDKLLDEVKERVKLK